MSDECDVAILGGGDVNPKLGPDPSDGYTVGSATTSPDLEHNRETLRVRSRRMLGKAQLVRFEDLLHAVVADPAPGEAQRRPIPKSIVCYVAPAFPIEYRRSLARQRTQGPRPITSSSSTDGTERREPPRPVEDRRDGTGAEVGKARRASPAPSRRCSTVGWRRGPTRRERARRRPSRRGPRACRRLFLSPEAHGPQSGIGPRLDFVGSDTMAKGAVAAGRLRITGVGSTGPKRLQCSTRLQSRGRELAPTTPC